MKNVNIHYVSVNKQVTEISYVRQVFKFSTTGSHNRSHYLNYPEKSLRATSTFLGSVPSSNI